MLFRIVAIILLGQKIVALNTSQYTILISDLESAPFLCIQTLIPTLTAHFLYKPLQTQRSRPITLSKSVGAADSCDDKVG